MKLKPCLLGTLFALILTHNSAWCEVFIDAIVSKPEISKDESCEFQIICTGTDGSEIVPQIIPAHGLRIQFRERTVECSSSQFSITSTYTYHFNVFPRIEGYFTIPSIKISVLGGVYKTPPVDLVVNPAKVSNEANSNQKESNKSDPFDTSKLKPVTDPKLLKDLNSGNSSSANEVTDPEILKRLVPISSHSINVAPSTSQYDIQFKKRADQMKAEIKESISDLNAWFFHKRSKVEDYDIIAKTIYNVQSLSGENLFSNLKDLGLSDSDLVGVSLAYSRITPRPDRSFDLESKIDRLSSQNKDLKSKLDSTKDEVERARNAADRANDSSRDASWKATEASWRAQEASMKAIDAEDAVQKNGY